MAVACFVSGLTVGGILCLSDPLVRAGWSRLEPSEAFRTLRDSPGVTGAAVARPLSDKCSHRGTPLDYVVLAVPNLHCCCLERIAIRLPKAVLSRVYRVASSAFFTVDC